MPIPFAFPEHDCKSQCGKPGGDMNDGSTGEIQGTDAAQNAAHAPYPVSDGVIYKSGPQDCEYQKSLEADPFHECSSDQSRCDDGKHHLICRKSKVWNGGCVISVGLRPYARQAQEIQAADQAAQACAECQGVSHEYPLQADETDSNKAQVDGGEKILPPNHAAVEECQRRR